MQGKLANWKTTVLGALTAFLLIGTQVKNVLSNDPNHPFDLQQVLIGLGVGGLGLTARDYNVSSEKSGAKPEGSKP